MSERPSVDEGVVERAYARLPSIGLCRTEILAWADSVVPRPPEEDLIDLMAMVYARIERDRASVVTSTLESLTASDLSALAERMRMVVIEADHLRDCNCPYPIIEDKTVGACIDAGKCGCVYGSALSSSPAGRSAPEVRD